MQINGVNNYSTLPSVNRQLSPIDFSSHLLRLNDADGDSQLTTEEIGDNLPHLASADQDSDGAISQKELSVALTEKLEGISELDEVSSINSFKSMLGSLQMPGTMPPDPEARSNDIIAASDTDGDGLLSAEELGTEAGKILGNADADVDGYISQEELNDSLVARSDHLQEITQQDIDARSNSLVADNDADGDGLLGTEELGSDAENIIGNADADADGYVSQEELTNSLTARARAVPAPYLMEKEPPVLEVLTNRFGMSEEDAGSILSILQDGRLDIEA